MGELNRAVGGRGARTEQKILVFIVAFNEASSIAAVIEDVQRFSSNADIVVIDDCSTDETASIAETAGVRVISHIVNSRTAGYAAVKTAMIYAYLRSYDICCQVDGDGQHDAAYLHRIVDPVANGSADMVIGSRFLGEQGYVPTLARATGIKVFSWITSLIIGQRIYDISSGFKASGRKIIRLIALYPHLVSDTNEMLILAKKNEARLLEVPVKMRARTAGQSWHSFGKFALYPMRTLLYILAVIVRDRNM